MMDARRFHQPSFKPQSHQPKSKDRRTDNLNTTAPLPAHLFGPQAAKQKRPSTKASRLNNTQQIQFQDIPIQLDKEAHPYMAGNHMRHTSQSKRMSMGTKLFVPGGAVNRPSMGYSSKPVSPTSSFRGQNYASQLAQGSALFRPTSGDPSLRAKKPHRPKQTGITSAMGRLKNLQNTAGTLESTLDQQAVEYMTQQERTGKPVKVKREALASPAQLL